MAKREIQRAEFTYVTDLIEALEELQETADAITEEAGEGTATMYVEIPEAFGAGGVAILMEETLTDGSKVYDVWLREVRT